MTTIRALTNQDYAQWLPLWQQYLDFYQSTLPPEVTDVTWQRLIAHPPLIQGYGFFADERLLGFVHFHYQWSSWYLERVIYLQDLFVAPEARRQGIARRLIDYIYQVAAAQHCARVFWITGSSNHTAQALYDQLAQKMDYIQYKHELTETRG